MTTLHRSAVLAIALLALAAAGAGAWLRLGVLVEAQRPIEHAQRVLAEVGHLALVANAADQTQRAYLSGQDPQAERTFNTNAAELDRTLTALAALTRTDPVQQRIIQDIRAAADGEDRFGRTVVLAGAMHDHQATLLDRELSRGSANAEEALQQVVGIIAAAALLVALAWWFSRTTAAATRPAAVSPPVPATDATLGPPVPPTDPTLSPPVPATHPGLGTAVPAVTAGRTAAIASATAADAAAAGRADVERHLADSPLTAEEVRGALAG
ncbi:CHASE3 domain-containing protein [Paractinoplanes rishiriensis]|uniref:CHASE3 domain-containing protein n=1 Tax=Paractinoplanes rishiriensis TaxID=1050105 RepID=A0A919MTB8_9ACTN|nr:CHASE3 domain-containing protein [Actinoplanes rishiriensis]GIE94583.1 hypothetical protein Ari01nite_20480 [Actinoplanes rishiriensis]